MAIDLKTSTRLLASSLHVGTDELHRLLRRADPRDLPRVSDLWARAFGPVMGANDSGYVTWKYGFGGVRDPYSTLWVLEVEGRILGCLGVEHVSLHLDGRSMEAGIAMDLAVDPDHDGLGIGVWLNLSLVQREGVLLTLGGNENSRRLIDRLFLRVAARETLTFGIRSSAMFMNSSRRRRLAFAGPLIDLYCEARRRSASTSAAGALETAMVSTFDSRLVDLWSRTRPATGISLRRDSEHLNWRYMENPRGIYRAFTAAARDELLGYVVVREGKLEDDSRELWLVDHLVEPVQRDAVLGALVGRVVTHARETGAVAIRVATFDPHVSASFRRQGFIAGTPGGGPFTMLVHDQQLRQQLERGIAPCHITELASDHDG